MIMNLRVSFTHLFRIIFQVLFFVLAYQQTYARVDYDTSKPLILPLELNSDDARSIVKAIIPASDMSGYSQQQVASRIMDNSLRYLWKTSPLRYTAVGQAANKVEKTVQVEKVIAATEEDKVEHKFSLDVQGLQALAQIKYSGWVKAAIQYNMKDASASAEVSEKIFEDKDLVLSQTIRSTTDSTSQVSLRWDW